MRLATLGFIHETNTFSPVPADFAAFERSGIWRGEDLRRRMTGGTAAMSGYFQAASDLGFEIVPLVFYHTGPIGLITKDAFERICDETLAAIKANGPWDGILIADHGAAVAEVYHDADGEHVKRIRSLVGPNVPIGLTLDLHGNMTREMVDATTCTIFYRTNPHLDSHLRGRECGEIIYRTIKGELNPVQWLETPPLVINILKQFTGEEPMKSVVADVEAVIKRPGMLSASVAEGYPWSDVPEMGASFLAVHNGDLEAAQAGARWLAQRAWANRQTFVGDAPTPREALIHAMNAPKGPIVLMDVGDNIGGGSSADSTVLLAEARRLGIGSYLQSLFDPEAVRACIAAGVGSTVTLRVGAKTDRLHGEPVEVTGRVRVIGDGQWEEWRPTHGGGRYFDAGPSVVLETNEDQTLVLTTHRAGNTSIQQMYCLGVQPETKKVIVAKGVHSPRPAYGPIAAEVVLVNTPGVTSADLDSFTYQHRRRPLFPFEPATTYS